MTKLFNDDLVNLKKDVIVADIDSQLNPSQIQGVACRSCGAELFQETGTIYWQCPNCNTRYEDKRYAKTGDGEITTSDGVSDLEASSADIISVDSYDIFKQANPTAREVRKRYRNMIFGKLPGTPHIVERD